MSLFEDHTTVYIGDPKESKKTTKKNPKQIKTKALELIRDFSNSAGYNINIQKSITFLYSNNECVEKI